MPSPSLRLWFPSLALTLVLALAGCDGGEADDEAGGSETGDAPASVTFVVVAGQAICGEFGGPLQLQTRRVDCWDPQQPCTVPSDPEWIVGTVGDCSIADNPTRWEVSVDRTGRYETRLQASDHACYGLDGVALTNIDEAALAAGGELELEPAPAGSCGPL